MSGRGLSISDGIDIIKGNSDNVASKQPLVLICSEKAVYVYSLLHIIQVCVYLSCCAYIKLVDYQSQCVFSLLEIYSGY